MAGSGEQYGESSDTLGEQHKKKRHPRYRRALCGTRAACPRRSSRLVSSPDVKVAEGRGEGLGGVVALGGGGTGAGQHVHDGEEYAEEDKVVSLLLLAAAAVARRVLKG